MSIPLCDPASSLCRRLDSTWYEVVRWFRRAYIRNPKPVVFGKWLENEKDDQPFAQFEKLLKWLPKCVPIPKQSILCPCSFKLNIVSSLISFDATIVNSENHGSFIVSATFSNVFLARTDKYAKSPLSILIPTALYPTSFNAKATAQKFKRPLLTNTKQLKLKKSIKKINQYTIYNTN